MSFDRRCPQCLFVSREIGQTIPCLLHVAPALAPSEPSPLTPGLTALADYDEPFELGQVRPTVDRPAPFSVRQLVRLQLLRTRMEGRRRGGLGIEPVRG